MNESTTYCRDGIVREIHPTYLVVEIHRPTACEACHAKTACMSSPAKNNKIICHYNCSEPVQLGDKVTVFLSKNYGKKALFLGYGLPFLVLFISLFIAYFLTRSEGWAALIAFIGMACYYTILYFLNREGKIDRQFSLMAYKTNG
jgi:sigma-E factor negative regulatory protein RseC